MAQTFLHWNLTLSTKLPQRTLYLLDCIWIQTSLLLSITHSHIKPFGKNNRLPKTIRIHAPCDPVAATTVQPAATATVAAAVVELVDQRARANVTVVAVR